MHCHDHVMFGRVEALGDGSLADSEKRGAILIFYQYRYCITLFLVYLSLWFFRFSSTSK